MRNAINPYWILAFLIWTLHKHRLQGQAVANKFLSPKYLRLWWCHWSWWCRWFLRCLYTRLSPEGFTLSLWEFSWSLGLLNHRDFLNSSNRFSRHIKVFLNWLITATTKRKIFVGDRVNFFSDSFKALPCSRHHHRSICHVWFRFLPWRITGKSTWTWTSTVTIKAHFAILSKNIKLNKSQIKTDLFN